MIEYLYSNIAIIEQLIISIALFFGLSFDILSKHATFLFFIAIYLKTKQFSNFKKSIFFSKE